MKAPRPRSLALLAPTAPAASAASAASVAALFLLTALSTGCDDDKKPTAAAAAASPAATTAAAAPSAAPAQSVAAVEPPRKKEYKCGPGPAVEFHDPVLETEVRRKLAKPTVTIKIADLKNVRTLNLSNGKVEDLDPCIIPHMSGLKEIFLGPGELHDLSPLSTLLNLESIRASINKVSSVEPLSKLTKLDRLDLGRKRTLVKDLSPLRGLKKLKFLYIAGTPIDDLSPISPLMARGLKVVKD
jgi:internalin A